MRRAELLAHHRLQLAGEAERQQVGDGLVDDRPRQPRRQPGAAQRLLDRCRPTPAASAARGLRAAHGLQVGRGGRLVGRLLNRPRLCSRLFLGLEARPARGILHPTCARERLERRLDVWIYLVLAGRFALGAVRGTEVVRERRCLFEHRLDRGRCKSFAGRVVVALERDGARRRDGVVVVVDVEHRRAARHTACTPGVPARASTSTNCFWKKPAMPPWRPSRWRVMIASAPSSSRICGSTSSRLRPRNTRTSPPFASLTAQPLPRSPRRCPA